MAAIALGAIDLAVVRFVFNDAGRMLLSLTLSVLPMANVLAVLAYRMATRKPSRPFAVGFFACGAVAMLIHLTVDRVYSEQMNKVYDIPNAPFHAFCVAHLPWPYSQDMNGMPKYFRYAALLTVPYSLPQFFAATLGGLATSYLRAPSRLARNGRYV